MEHNIFENLPDTPSQTLGFIFPEGETDYMKVRKKTYILKANEPRGANIVRDDVAHPAVPVFSFHPY